MWRILSCVALLAVAGGVALSNGQPELEIQLIYDNTAAHPALTADWGFAALVSFRGRDVLFDAGTKPDSFLENARKLGIDFKQISAAVISHEHGDHINGIYDAYALNPSMKVFFLADA